MTSIGVRHRFQFQRRRFQGNLSPAPDYKLYLTKTFVTDEEDFLKKKIKVIRLMDFYLIYWRSNLECYNSMVSKFFENLLPLLSIETKINFSIIKTTMTQRYSGLILLILAGELIFSLPFHITRFFKSGVLEVFQISNTNLGDAFAFYGIFALLSYFPGGYLADRYPPRKLIFYSLLFTGIGGIYFATIPKPAILPYLYAFWGITTILFFWGALIKYTSDWGGIDQQGRAFGYLEAGRALVASIFSSIAFLLVYLFSQNSESFSRNSIQLVILFYAITTIVLSFLVLFFLRDKIKTEN